MNQVKFIESFILLILQIPAILILTVYYCFSMLAVGSMLQSWMEG